MNRMKLGRVRVSLGGMTRNRPSNGEWSGQEAQCCQEL